MSDDTAKLVMMLEHAYDAAAAVHGKNRRSLDKDLLLVNALSQSLGLLGETVGELSKGFKGLYRQINWDDMANLRKFLFQKFARENKDLLWQAAEDQLPIFITELKAIVPPDEDEE